MHHIFIAPFEICSYGQFNYCYEYLEIGFGGRAGKQHCLVTTAKQDLWTLGGYKFFLLLICLSLIASINNLSFININLLRLSVSFHQNWGV